MAEKLVSAIHEPSTVDYSFALARAMANRKLAIEEIARFVTSAGHLSGAVLENLFLLDDSESVLATFQLQPSQVCLADRCIETELISDLHDCGALDQFLRSARGDLNRAAALKSWLFTSGQELVRSCVVQGLHEPIEKVRETTIGTVFLLSLFNPAMNLNDTINGFRAGMFEKFDFIDADVSRLANLRLSSPGSLSPSFARRILDQLDAAPSTLVAAVSASTAVDTLLRTVPWAGAHYTYLLCRTAAVSSADCSRRSIYLREIAKSL